MIESAWSDADARAAVARYTERFPATCNEDVALRVYTAQLIGRDPSLVLHGGGNTSVKTELPDEVGRSVPVLSVKGSGHDLARMEPPVHPAVRLAPLTALRKLDNLSDAALVNALRTRLFDATAPNPSVEALMHAFLPHKYVDHSHADAVLALLDQQDAETLCREVFGDVLAVVPYIMPGFALAKLTAEIQDANPECHGLLLLQHGLVTFGGSARESYERHIASVRRAQEFISSRAGHRATSVASGPSLSFREIGPVLRGRLGEGQRRYVLDLRRSESIDAFVNDGGLESLALRGPATPDHVIRTKRHPLILEGASRARDEEALGELIEGHLARYREDYKAYVSRQRSAKQVTRAPLDPDPRVILVPRLGMIGAGASRADARIAADIYERTIDIIRSAEVVGRYQALPESDLFDMEYWSLEQAKLGKTSSRPPLAGRVVYVTGAASGIGAATAGCFARAGAHVYLVDRAAEGLDRVAKELDCPCEVVDVTRSADVEESVGRVVDHFGGIDGAVSNAGNAPQSPMHDCPERLLRDSLELNLLSHQWVASSVARVLRRQGMGGFLLFNASKAAFNPGPNFGPYAVAKAGVVALMRQYALEEGAFGIRANAVNADRIRTGLFPREMVEARARARGLEPDEYFKANLLGREVTADDVAGAFLSLALAESTTGAVLTVDGGNIAAAPR